MGERETTDNEPVKVEPIPLNEVGEGIVRKQDMINEQRFKQIQVYLKESHQHIVAIENKLRKQEDAIRHLMAQRTQGT